MYITGIDSTERVAGTGTSSDEGNQHSVLSLGANQTANGAEIFIYVHAQEALTVNAVCVVHETGECEMADTTSTAAAAGQGLPAGVATAAFADNDFGWLQVWGVVANVSVGTSAAAHTILNSTATAGRLDDDATAGAEEITGITTTAAESSNLAAGILHWPMVSTTL